MFKDYKEIFKNLRDVQDQLWKDSMASFPATAFQHDMSEWQQQTLERVNNMVEQAIGHSLELQQQWLEQWSERAIGGKLKPGTFADLSAEAGKSSKRWLDNQNQLLDQWLQILRGSGPDAHANFTDWEKTVQESIQRQMTLLNSWSEMADFEKLSVKEITKLSSEIAKSMQKSIETQQQLWSHWFSELGATNETEAKPQKATASASNKQTQKKKGSAKAKKPAGTATPPFDDLKQISGIGPGLEKKLKAGGITTLRQIAELSDADIADLEERIIRFSGRIKREQWVEQARKLIS